jgi:hypothetical protein
LRGRFPRAAGRPPDVRRQRRLRWLPPKRNGGLALVAACSGHAGGHGRAVTKAGTFSRALADGANKNGWTAISMKNDWKAVFAKK